MHSILSYFPFTDPTAIFFVVLCIILLAPMLFSKLHIPQLAGMLLAGVAIGEHGLGFLHRDSSFEIFGNVGLLYIMFLAGVEIDLTDFARNKHKGIAFGLLTFLLPFGLGFGAAFYLLHLSTVASLLMATMFSSHTLISYAIVRRFGITHVTSVTMSVGGTLITDTLALLVLAVVSHTLKDTPDFHFWVVTTVSIVAFTFAVLYFFPRLGRLFFRRINDQVLQFIFILAMLFLAALGARYAGLEGILGAFLAGIAFNRLVPSVSPLMNRLSFVGNALFIPYFLIGVGMLIDLHGFFLSPTALLFAGVMTVIGVTSKYLAAFGAGKLFRMRREEWQMLFGLSVSRTAATLAVVTVGYRLGVFDKNVLNGTLVLILLTCIISSFVVERSSRCLATATEAKIDDEIDEQRTLIAYANPKTVEDLTQVALLLRNKRETKEMRGIHIVLEGKDAAARQKVGKISLRRASQIATAADVPMITTSRLGTNIASGIVHTMQENDVSEVLLGMHHKGNFVDSFVGSILQNLLQVTYKQVLVVKCVVPINTIRQITVAVPAKAEYEQGFHMWIEQLCRMGKELACRMVFFSTMATRSALQTYIDRKYKEMICEYSELDDWDDLLLLTKHNDNEHLFVFVSSRHGFISYQPAFEKLHAQLATYFGDTSLLMIYPDQYGKSVEWQTFTDSQNDAFYQQFNDGSRRVNG